MKYKTWNEISAMSPETQVESTIEVIDAAIWRIKRLDGTALRQLGFYQRLGVAANLTGVYQRYSAIAAIVTRLDVLLDEQRDTVRNEAQS